MYLLHSIKHFMKIHKLLFLLSILSATITMSCKTDSSNNALASFSGLEDLKQSYSQSPDPTSASKLIKELLETLKNPDVDDKQRSDLLQYGYKIAKEQNISSRAATFLFPIIKDTDPNNRNPDQLFELAGLMKGMNKKTASNTLYQSLVDNFSSYSKIAEAKSAITDTFNSVDDYIFGLGEKLFVDPDNTGINRAAALNYVDACEAYALAYPSSPKAAESLFKSAEVAKSLRTFPKSLSLYDWILEKYPSYEKAPTALFLKGFIIENNIGDDKKAREIYDQFLAEYPTNDLADDVEFLIENLGKSDEEILQMIEEKRKQKVTETK